MIELIVELPSVFFNEKSSTRDIVLPYVLDGWGFPLFAKSGLINPAFDFMVVFEISFVQVDALHEVLFGNRISRAEFTSNSF